MASNEDLSRVTFALNNGSGAIPALGFGTSLSDRTKTRDAVKAAVKVGFRHLDAAERYRNEAEVGAALKELFARRHSPPRRAVRDHQAVEQQPSPRTGQVGIASQPRAGSGSTPSTCIWCTPRSRSSPATTKIPATRTELSSMTTASRWRKPGQRWKALSTKGLPER